MRKQPNRWLIFSSLAFQMGILFFGAVQLGDYLDQNTPGKKYFTMLICAVALIASLILINKQSKRF